jgi:hypothetical protein
MEFQYLGSMVLSMLGFTAFNPTYQKMSWVDGVDGINVGWVEQREAQHR